MSRRHSDEGPFHFLMEFMAWLLASRISCTTQLKASDFNLETGEVVIRKEIQKNGLNEDNDTIGCMDLVWCLICGGFDASELVHSYFFIFCVLWF